MATMAQWFIFGIANYFQFTFRHGPKTSSLIDETVDVESSTKDSTNPKARKQKRTKTKKRAEKTFVSSPSLITGNTASLPCGTLGKLPPELRTMIYKKVLKFEKCVEHPQKFMDRPLPIMAKEATHIEAIDAALLRTCRTVYQEAVHILYAMNRFHFTNPEDIEKFAHFGLGNTPFGYYRTASEPLSADRKTPYGRSTMIRQLSLRFMGSRSRSWSLWYDFFYPPEKQTQLIGFPALDWLCLNLTHWGLDSEDASKIRIKPFLKRFRPTGGLNHLKLIGVSHEQNLRDFKHGFVKEGGTFRPASSSVKTIPTVTVTHDDLREVSMYVRALVENDRASRAEKIRRRQRRILQDDPTS